jgi:hypothetical protein
MCLVVINIAAPFLVIAYWNFGQGKLMIRLSSFFMVLSFAAGVAAIVFLWLLYPREVDVERAAVLSLEFLNAQRSGRLDASSYPIPWRFDSGVQYKEIPARFENQTTNQVLYRNIDLSGGFYNDGEVGPVKLTWNIAMTTTMLAWSMLEYKAFWERDLTLKNDITNLIAHGSLYLQNCYVQSPNPLAEDKYDLLYYVVRFGVQVFLFTVSLVMSAPLVLRCGWHRLPTAAIAKCISAM